MRRMEIVINPDLRPGKLVVMINGDGITPLRDEASYDIAATQLESRVTNAFRQLVQGELARRLSNKPSNQ